jgi:hypothetical protein
MKFPSKIISRKIINLHTQGVDVLDLTLNNIARLADIRRKDVEMQLPEINNLIATLQK